MANFGNDLLESWGFDPVDFTTDPGPDEGSIFSYDPSTGLIHMDPDALCSEDNGAMMAGLVGHEAFHAAFDQAEWSDVGDDNFGDLSAYQFGADITYDLDSECTSTESGSVGDVPDFPWVYDTQGVPF